MKVTVRIHLDGPRQVDVDVPDDWHSRDASDQGEIVAEALERLVWDAIAVEIEEK